MLIAIIASLDLSMFAFDFTGAYLNAEPQGDNYLEIPKGFKNWFSIDNTDTVLHMLYNVYGTMDGGANWFLKLDSTFTELGHRASRSDPCVRVHHSPLGKTITATYTDNMIGGSKSREAGAAVTKEMGERYELKDLGEPDKILGISIIRDKEAGTISLHQQSLIRELVKECKMTGCRPKYTPLPPNLNLINSQSLPIPETDVFFMADKPYRGALGKMNHIGNGTRLNISYAMSFLMTFAIDPRPVHWNLVQHVVAYLDTTISRLVTYRRGVPIKPLGFSDSSYADNPETRRSTAGYVFTMAGGPVSWRAKSQSRVGTSTAEVKYVSLSESGKHGIWMRNWLHEMELFEDGPIELKTDNNAAISIANRTVSGHSRLKHVDVKHHWIQEAVVKRDITVSYVPTSDNVADIFTKSLGRVQLEKLLGLLGM